MLGAALSTACGGEFRHQEDEDGIQEAEPVAEESLDLSSRKNAKLYLHWSATAYNWYQSGHYHMVIQGGGKVVGPSPGFDRDMGSHTYARNTNSMSMSMACMGGSNPWSTPCTRKQIETMCQKAAQLAKDIGWTAADITVKRVMTHGEAAASRDYSLSAAQNLAAHGNSESFARSIGLPHDNYGPSSWPDGWPGGTVERWDLWHLANGRLNGKCATKNEAGQYENVPEEWCQVGKGGDVLRALIKSYMGGTTYSTAVALQETRIKKRLADSSSLQPGEWCGMSANRVLGFSAYADAGQDHWRLTVTVPPSQCPTFTGTVYVYKPHFSLR